MEGCPRSMPSSPNSPHTNPDWSRSTRPAASASRDRRSLTVAGPPGGNTCCPGSFASPAHMRAGRPTCWPASSTSGTGRSSAIDRLWRSKASKDSARGRSSSRGPEALDRSPASCSTRPDGSIRSTSPSSGVISIRPCGEAVICSTPVSSPRSEPPVSPEPCSTWPPSSMQAHSRTPSMKRAGEVSPRSRSSSGGSKPFVRQVAPALDGWTRSCPTAVATVRWNVGSSNWFGAPDSPARPARSFIRSQVVSSAGSTSTSRRCRSSPKWAVNGDTARMPTELVTLVAATSCSDLASWSWNSLATRSSIIRTG